MFELIKMLLLNFNYNFNNKYYFNELCLFDLVSFNNFNNFIIIIIIEYIYIFVFFFNYVYLIIHFTLYKCMHALWSLIKR